MNWSAFSFCVTDFPCLLVQVLNGIAVSMILFLIASGLSLIFGVLGVKNFAHGSLYMLGGYAAYALTHQLSAGSLPFWLAVVAASLVVAGLGALLEVLILRRVYGRYFLYQLLVTFALLLVFEDLVKIIWGTGYLTVSMPPGLRGAVRILGRPFPLYYTVLIVLGPLVALGLWLLLTGTRYGKLIRAASSDRETLAVLGVNVPRIFTSVFAFGSWLAALGGALAAPMRAFSPGIGVEVAIESFIVVVVGGLGNIWGALLGALIIGQLRVFGALAVPRFELVFPFALMAIILILRPRGLLGR